MRHPIEEILKCQKQGRPMDPKTAISIIQENMAFRSLLKQAIALMTEDPVELRKIEVEALPQWKKRTQHLLDEET